MEITEKHINFVIAFFVLALAFYFTQSILLAIVAFFGTIKGIKKTKQMRDTWNEESVDPSKIAQ